ncbi:C4-dicarboxylate TRAP transporter substrate-binding protein [Alkalihalobacillus oceani]|uniref:C4-dicarboxylate TRAP transporter substrate-binding protein n=1 Tax=Halalkalibacter oceani TaxID=1653776 RepID=UPI00203A5096|nr:C4-dicarboxylate TRAP transporter substrate-binding protein [Halalkalibacter oceani]MCM3760015.1 C4-dicarboxylate TRAP transporter substrate-binding protein [Halalkalibacter oceani]
MRRKWPLLFFVSIVSVIALLGCSGNEKTEGAGGSSESNDPTYTLRFGHVLTEQDPFHASFKKWAEAVSEKTEGDVLIEVFPNAQLGVEEDVLEQMRQGSNIGWQTDSARLGNYVNEIAVLNAPYFLESLDEVRQLMESEVMEEWQQRLEEEYQIKVISFAYAQGHRNVFSNKVGTNPDEFKGMLLRTAGAPIWVESVNSLGSEAVALPYGDLYNGIQTNVVDGAELSYAAARNLNVQEVADHIIETQHIYLINFVVSSAEWFNSLPEEYQTILIEEANNAGLEVSEQLEAEAEGHKQALIDAGMNYIPYDELDIEAFKKAGQAAYDALDLNDARKAIYEELGKEIAE